MTPRETILRHVAATAVAAALALTVAAPAVAQEARTLPVYDLETPGHALQVRVDEEDFAAGTAFPWQDLAAVAASPEQPPEVRLTVRYLKRAVEGRYDELPELFWMETTSPRAIRTLAQLVGGVVGRLGELRRLTFLHTWHYADFRTVVVRVEGDAGASRVLGFGLVERDGELLRSDDWGRALPVMDLFSYMARNLNKGLVDDHAVAGFPLSLTLPAPRHPVVLQFDGTVHGPGAAEGPDAGEVHPVVALARLAFSVAAAGTDAEFLSLWAPEDQEELAEVLATAPGRFSGLRADFSPGGVVRHLLTADLGEYGVHYYRVPGSPQVRSLVFQNVGGELRLSDGLYSNIKNLMVSDLTHEQVAALVPVGESE